MRHCYDLGLHYFCCAMGAYVEVYSGSRFHGPVTYTSCIVGILRRGKSDECSKKKCPKGQERCQKERPNHLETRSGPGSEKNDTEYQIPSRTSNALCIVIHSFLSSSLLTVIVSFGVVSFLLCDEVDAARELEGALQQDERKGSCTSIQLAQDVGRLPSMRQTCAALRSASYYFPKKNYLKRSSTVVFGHWTQICRPVEAPVKGLEDSE